MHARERVTQAVFALGSENERDVIGHELPRQTATAASRAASGYGEMIHIA
jgi:hypothetical protein